MAPPVEIIKRDKVEEKLRTVERRAPDDCLLKELKQYECEVRDNEIVCVPFIRLFKQCGLKLFEITNKDTNS